MPKFKAVEPNKKFSTVFTVSITIITNIYITHIKVRKEKIMKIIVNKEDMKTAVTKVIGAVSAKSVISAIEGILLK